MHIVHDLESIRSILPSLQEKVGDDASFALVFLPNCPDDNDFYAVSQAVRICDIAIVSALASGFEVGAWKKKLQELGVQVLFAPRCFGDASHVTVDFNVDGINGSHLLQVVLSVMPSAVMVPFARVGLSKAIYNMQMAFADLFLPMFTLTPQDHLSDEVLPVRQIMQMIVDKLKTGIENINQLKVFSENACKSVGGVELQELKILGRNNLQKLGDIGNLNNSVVYVKINTQKGVIEDCIKCV